MTKAHCGGKHRLVGGAGSRNGRRISYHGNSKWRKWLFPFIGFLSLIWFIARVVPKPRRAVYPCQRIAAPLAGSFILWILGSGVFLHAARLGRRFFRQSRFVTAVVCLMVAAAAALAALINMPAPPALANVAPAHEPIGVGQGIHPGRVVWVHAPEATDWSGVASSEHWFESNHTDAAVVRRMVAQAVRGVAGKSADAAAWDAIFKDFNARRGKGDMGYIQGEKIAIKINLTTCNARTPLVNTNTYDKLNDWSSGTNWLNTIDNSPQMICALLEQLARVVGVAETNITVGDPTGLFPNYMRNLICSEFPGVHCMDNLGGAGRTRVEFSTTPFYWSNEGAQDKLQDYLPVCFAEADYMINMAVLKTHDGAGITLCGKNHFGSLIRCPDGYLRDVGYMGYFDIHDGAWQDGTGRYRPQVDLMGHRELGGKTLLYFIDGLFAGTNWMSYPIKWMSPPFGNQPGGDWPSSFFASQDPVAIDSVGYDFLLAEWPAAVMINLEGGSEDYLHEAAQADNPPSGTFYDPEGDGSRLASLGVHEHWNDSTNKQYSRNLGHDHGIELLALTADTEPELLPLSISNEVATLQIQHLIPSASYGVQVTTDPVTGSWSATDVFSADSTTRLWSNTVNVTRHGIYYRLKGE